MALDDALDRLLATLAAAGMPPPQEPSGIAAIGEIEEAVAPLRLPSQVRRFWERVDPATLGLQPSIEWAAPSFALSGWRGQREDFPGGSPANLFTLGYQSWCYMAVELDEPGRERGAIFEWSNPDSDFVPRWHDLAQWLETLSEILASGEVQRGEAIRHGARRPELRIAEQVERAASYAALAADPLPSTERDPEAWPEHWLRASGLAPELTAARGITHTLAELLSLEPESRAAATIAAEVRAIGGHNALVSDGETELVVLCPPAVSALGPILGQWFEFDVLRGHDPGGAPDAPPARAVLAEAVEASLEDLPIDEAFAEMVRSQIAPRPFDAPDATATAIRRLEGEPSW